MPGLLLPDGSYHDSAPAEKAQEPQPDPEQALADAHAALADETAEPAEIEIVPCRTAFTIYLSEDGVVSYGDIPWDGPVPSRKPTFDEMYHAAEVAGSFAWRVPGDAKSCLTAFSPYLTHDGRWLISADPNDPLVADREPTNDEIDGGLAVVKRDIQTQEIGALLNQFAQAIVQSTTQSVMQNMMQMGNAMREAQASQQVAQQLEADKRRRAHG